MTGAAPLLAVDDLGVTYGTGADAVRAVAGIGFALAAGQKLALVGESGSGKTAALLALAGLLGGTGARVSGSVRFRGQEILGMRAATRRRLRGRDMAMIFQDPMSALTPAYSIGWQIVEQLRAHTDVSRRAAWRRAEALLEATGLPEPAATARRYPHQLSGGMRQRAMIAMALSCAPSLIIADEPTTALDVTVQAQILDLLRRLGQDSASALLLVTHDMGVVAEMADAVLVMYAGRIVEHGPVAQVFAHPGHPYTAALLASIPPLRGPRLHRLPAIPGSPPERGAPEAGCAFAPRCAHRHAACAQTPPIFTRAFPDGGMQHAACFLLAEERA